MNILLCGSTKYRDQIDKAIQALAAAGHTPLFPDGETVSKDLDEADWKKQMAHEHYRAMKTADAVYFVLPAGYMGTSVTLELGYAAALNKPIFFSELTQNLALDHYPVAIIPITNLSDLEDYLEN